jgi:hypothetical protein
MSKEIDIYTKLGLNAERVAGYLYSGICISIVSTLIFPKEVSALISALGGVLSVLSVFAIGFATYVLYRYIIGEYLLFPLQHFIHRLLDYILGRSKKNPTSSIDFIKNLGVPKGLRRDAYTAIRDAFFNDETRARLDLVHGEIHALYITAVDSFLISGLSFLKPMYIPNWTWIFVGIFTLIGGLIADTHQHTIETRMIKAIDPSKLKEFLRQDGHLIVNIPL